MITLRQKIEKVLKESNNRLSTESARRILELILERKLILEYIGIAPADDVLNQLQNELKPTAFVDTDDPVELAFAQLEKLLSELSTKAQKIQHHIEGNALSDGEDLNDDDLKLKLDNELLILYHKILNRVNKIDSFGSPPPSRKVMIDDFFNERSCTVVIAQLNVFMKIMLTDYFTAKPLAFVDIIARLKNRTFLQTILDHPMYDNRHSNSVSLFSMRKVLNDMKENGNTHYKAFSYHVVSYLTEHLLDNDLFLVSLTAETVDEVIREQEKMGIDASVSRANSYMAGIKRPSAELERVINIKRAAVKLESGLHEVCLNSASEETSEEEYDSENEDKSSSASNGSVFGKGKKIMSQVRRFHLPASDEWQKRTRHVKVLGFRVPVFGRSARLKEVDAALQKYNQISPYRSHEKAQALEELIHACNRYCNMRLGRSRRAGKVVELQTKALQKRIEFAQIEQEQEHSVL